MHFNFWIRIWNWSYLEIFNIQFNALFVIVLDKVQINVIESNVDQFFGLETNDWNSDTRQFQR